MAKDQVKTFAVAGDAEVGKRLAATLVAAGFTQAEIAQADAVITYCSNIPALEDLYYDSKGLLQNTKEGVVLVDLSPATVTFARELNAVALVSERYVLDAPVVVSNVVVHDAFANPANLGLVVGGDEKIFRNAEPLLRALASRVMWMGVAGAGQAAKVATTLQAAAGLVGIVEAQASLSVSEVQVDVEDVMDFLTSMDAVTPAQEAFMEAMADDSFEGSFAIEHLMGEVAAALSSVDDSELILPQAESGFRLMELLAMVGGVSFNPAALKLVFADEETSNQHGLDWSRAEGAYDDHECECGHDHNDPDHECCGHHHHHHDDDDAMPTGFVGFSSN